MWNVHAAVSQPPHPLASLKGKEEEGAGGAERGGKGAKEGGEQNDYCYILFAIAIFIISFN